MTAIMMHNRFCEVCRMLVIGGMSQGMSGEEAWRILQGTRFAVPGPMFAERLLVRHGWVAMGDGRFAAPELEGVGDRVGRGE